MAWRCRCNSFNLPANLRPERENLKGILICWSAAKKKKPSGYFLDKLACKVLKRCLKVD